MNNNSGGSRSSSNEKSTKSRIVEWPAYDPLYKKYLTIGTHQISDKVTMLL
jgi:hypothetical protein